MLPQNDGALWTTNEIHSVISLVREYPQLYDRKHPEYKHNTKKEMAWEQISEALKPKTAIQCKRKWNTLRIQQRRIYTSEQRRKGAPKKIVWHCYDLLRFLIPHMEWIGPATDGDEPYKGDMSDYDEEILDDHQDTTASEDMKPYYTNETSSNGSRYQLELHEPNATTHTYAESSDMLLVQNPNHQSSDEQHNHDTKSDNFTVGSASPTNISTPIEPKVNARPPHIQLATAHNSHSQPAHYHHSCGSAVSGHQSDSGTLGGGVNYFLMDVQQQMDKLNDLAQIELKIDIQKLLLEKLRCANNLRHD